MKNNWTLNIRVSLLSSAAPPLFLQPGSSPEKARLQITVRSFDRDSSSDWFRGGYFYLQNATGSSFSCVVLRRKECQPLVMREKNFWKLVDKSRSVLARTPEKQQERMIRSLSNRSLQEINGFDCYFRHYMELSNTWELKSAAALIRGDDSKEFFQDFRAWLIFRGKKVFYLVLRQPDKAAKYISLYDQLDWSGFDTCAAEAFELKSGREIPPPGETRGSRPGERELPDRFPKLWKKFVR